MIPTSSDRPPKSPLVSVVLPVFNCECFLTDAIQSILNQTFADFELICVDDGSDDATPEILNQFAGADARVRLIRTEHVGVTAANNVGLRSARGEFIARMDADDIALPERFEKQLAFMKSHPDVVLVGSQVLMVDPEGLPIHPKRDTSYHHAEIVESLLNKGWPIVQPAVMLRAAAVRQIGGYDERYRTVQDHDLFLRLTEVGQLVNLPEILLHYRQHFGSISYARASEQAETLTTIVQRARTRRGLPMPDHLLDSTPSDRSPTTCRSEWVWASIKAGNMATARKHAMALLIESPSEIARWKMMIHAILGPRPQTPERTAPTIPAAESDSRLAA